MSAIHDRIAGVLRDSDGLDLSEIIECCGDGLGERVTPKWWEDRIREMPQHGYTVAEDRGVYYLVAERGVERDGGSVSGFSPGVPMGGSAVSLSAGQLFETPETPAVYREEAA